VRVGAVSGSPGLVGLKDTAGARVVTLGASGKPAGSQVVSPPGAVLRDFVVGGARAGAVSIAYDPALQLPGPRGHLYVTSGSAAGRFSAPELIDTPGVENGPEARLALDPRSRRSLLVWMAGRITGNVGGGGLIRWAADY
jgi:hypothetical protein